MGRQKQRRPLSEKLTDYKIVGECWEYNGCVDNCGYCQIYVNGKLQYAHRLAYEFYKGKIPAGMTVDHICFNRKCINPAHLQLLTRRENCRRHQFSQKTIYCRICGAIKHTIPSGRSVCRKCSVRRTLEYRKRKQGRLAEK